MNVNVIDSIMSQKMDFCTINHKFGAFTSYESLTLSPIRALTNKYLILFGL